MSKDSPASAPPPRLPPEILDWLAKPLKRFLKIEATAGLILLIFTILALVIANSPLGHRYFEVFETPVGLQIGSLELARSLREWINDALMTLFFFLIALELKRELVLGELRKPRAAALSIMAALGGMLVPAVLYYILQAGQPGEHGWGTVMATDTAFVVGALALLGSRIPHSLRLFMLSLAIVDDIGAILVVVVGYRGNISFEMLALAIIGCAIVFGLARLGVRSVAVYFLLGSVIWLTIDASGVHATITGVILGMMTPTVRWVSRERLSAILNKVIAGPFGTSWSGDSQDRRELRMAEAAARETLSPVERLEMILHPWVGFVVIPLFAFANAGVVIPAAVFGNAITLAVFAGFAFGKPIGVLSFSWLALRTGIATLPADLDWVLLTAGGLLAGVGFTMAIFIANLAFPPDLIDTAKLGILLASVFSGVAGLLVLVVWSFRGKELQASRRSK